MLTFDSHMFHLDSLSVHAQTVFLAVRFHTIIESLELEETLKSHLVQLLCNEQGHLQLDQVAQSPIQFDLECLQRWGIHHISGQPVPAPHHHQFFLYPVLISLNEGFMMLSPAQPLERS